ncbi:hypothetical protein IHV77_08205 [Rodentibacter haemolyticus]|uniref:Maltose/galactoside acetyltransferase domain-containing protein n=2 Tax=Rodentibacter haemolyticus TaxID=2778911 RepID=A0ABX6UV46_9PAST|nr:hypothetical protein IHV77_08205 [Rodentibacter haemolyticus]
MTEYEKMVAGELYNPMHPDLIEMRVKARDLTYDFNQTRLRDIEKRTQILKSLSVARAIGSMWKRACKWITVAIFTLARTFLPTSIV